MVRGVPGDCLSVPDLSQEEKTRNGMFEKKNKRVVKLEKREVLGAGGEQKQGRDGRRSVDRLPGLCLSS